MKIRRILVPVDLSDCAARVVEHAVGLARIHDARVLLLHVAPAPPGLAGDVEIDPAGNGELVEVHDHLRQEAGPRLEPYLSICSRDEVPARGAVVAGEPAAEILDRAQAWQADIIVMGTHGRKGLARLVLGSVSEEVLRRSDAPVMSIRAVHTEACDADSCSWCASGGTEAEARTRAELDG